jgi:hypothetical protein
VTQHEKALHARRWHVGRSSVLVQDEPYLLIVIRVAMAPVPVMLLVAMLPVLVRNVRVVALLLVVPIGTVFPVIPVVVVMVMRVVNANLNPGILRRGCCHDGTADCEGSRQEQPA